MALSGVPHSGSGLAERLQGMHKAFEQLAEHRAALRWSDLEKNAMATRLQQSVEDADHVAFQVHRITALAFTAYEV
jgi:hypothetical protein